MLRCAFCAFLITLISCMVSFVEPRNCVGPPETGNCRAAMPKWFYNATAFECQQFIYGGCGGNDNRHNTREACESMCVEHPTTTPSSGGETRRQRTARPPTTRERHSGTRHTATFHGGRVAVIAGSNVTLECKLEATNPIDWFFYPPNSIRVVRLSDDNSGRFSHVADMSSGQNNLTIGNVQSSDGGRYECLERQTTNAGVQFFVDVYPAASPENCSGDPVTGRCRAWIPRWFYNTTASECQRFVYGGCGGTANSYESRPLCERTCLGRPMQHVPASGSGRSSSGSGTGSGERGRSRGSKTTTAATTTAAVMTLNDQPMSGSANRPECSGLAVTGPCRAAFRKWFYNAATSRCQQFIYGGCGGSANRYDTRAQCERSCRG